MKLQNNNASNVVLSEGVDKTTSFSIARTPHMFNILSSGLYSDKIAAVLREVGCNANDAHIMAGTPDVPFEVKLPTALDPSFYIKDFGPGLSDHEVTSLYTTYGWSSKQNNEDVTGAFGLGSKSPFAYTMQSEDSKGGFTVESSKDGRHGIYACYIKPTGEPAISLLHEGPSPQDWPHGLKVSLSVRPGDVAEFHQKARDIYKWFKVKPSMLGGQHIEMAAPSFEGKNFKLRANHTGEPCVITGNVRYPIKPARMKNLTTAHLALLNSNVELYLPVGTVMMTPSREELEYTDFTRTALTSALDTAVQEVGNTLLARVNAPVTSQWEWNKAIHDYSSSLSGQIRIAFKNFLEAVDAPLEKIKNVVDILNTAAATLPAVGDDRLTQQAGVAVSIYAEMTNGRRTAVRRTSVISGEVAKGRDSVEPARLNFKLNCVVVYADAPNADARIRYAIDEEKYGAVVLVSPFGECSKEDALKVATQICTTGQTEGVPLVKVSELALPERIQKAKEYRTKIAKLSDEDIKNQTDVNVIDLATLTKSTVALGSVGMGRYFYAVKCGRNSYHPALRHAVSKGQNIELRCDNTTLKALHVLAQAAGISVTGYIVVESVAEAKKLKLEKLGCRPLLAYLKECLSSAQFKSFAESVPSKCDVTFANHWTNRSIGILGVMLSDMSSCAQLRRKLYKDPRFAQLKEFAEVVEKKVKNAQASQLAEALHTIRANFSGLSFTLGSTLSSEDLSRETYEMFPVSHMLDYSELINNFDSKTAETQEAWLTVLSEVFKAPVKEALAAAA